MIRFCSLIDKEENEIDEAINIDSLVDYNVFLNEAGNQSPNSTPNPMQGSPNGGQFGKEYNPDGIVLGTDEITTRMSWNARNKDPKYAIRNGTFYNENNDSNSYFVMWYLFGMSKTTNNLIKSISSSAKKITAFEGICPSCIQQLYNWIITENGNNSTYYNDDKTYPDFLSNEQHVKRIALGTNNIQPRPILNPNYTGNFCLKNEIFEGNYTGDISNEDFNITPMAGFCLDLHESQVDASKMLFYHTSKQKEGWGYLESDQVWNSFYEDDSIGFQNYWNNILTNRFILEDLQSIDLSLGFDGTCRGIKYDSSVGPDLDRTTIMSSIRELGSVAKYREIVENDISPDLGFSNNDNENFALTRGNISYWLVNTTFKNMEINGLPQFLQENMHCSDYFAITSNKDLFYAINHYPPSKTGWINYKTFANALYLSDKERPIMGRINNALNMMGTPSTQKAGKGRVIT